MLHPEEFCPKGVQGHYVGRDLMSFVNYVFQCFRYFDIVPGE